MNAKKAKAIRKKAREAAEGLPERLLMAELHKDGKRATARNNFDTERGIYRRLKASV